jgi:hypothetical protein
MIFRAGFLFPGTSPELTILFSNTPMSGSGKSIQKKAAAALLFILKAI